MMVNQMSMDEIIARIERLPAERQRQLLGLLCERLGIRDLVVDLEKSYSSSISGS